VNLVRFECAALSLDALPDFGARSSATRKEAQQTANVRKGSKTDQAAKVSKGWKADTSSDTKCDGPARQTEGGSVNSRVGLLAIFWFAVASCHHSNSLDANTREHLVSNMRLVLKSWDKDGDGKLSRSEVQTMVDASFRRIALSVPAGEAHPELEKQRQETLGFYASQDTNHDGYLTLDELLAGPLATFDCLDVNHDGKVSKEEAFGGMGRCPSVNLDKFAPNGPTSG